METTELVGISCKLLLTDQPANIPVLENMYKALCVLNMGCMPSAFLRNRTIKVLFVSVTVRLKNLGLFMWKGEYGYVGLFRFLFFLLIFQFFCTSFVTCAYFLLIDRKRKLKAKQRNPNAFGALYKTK